MISFFQLGRHHRLVASPASPALHFPSLCPLNTKMYLPELYLTDLGEENAP